MTDESNKENDGAIPTVGDRGNLIVKGKKKSKKGLILLLFIVVIIVLVIVIVPVVLKKRAQPDENANQRLQVDETLLTSQQDDRSLSSKMDEIVKNQQKDEAERLKAQQDAIDKARKEKEARERAEREKAELERIKHQNDMPEPDVQASGGGAAGKGNNKAPLTPAQRKLQGETLVNLGKDTKSDNVPQNQGGAMNDSLRGESYSDGKVGLLGNKDYLLVHGTQLPCVLKTKIVTTYKGLVLCQLTKDIYSANAATLLLRRGTTFFGEQKVAVGQGQARVFLNWTEADTPEGVTVRMDSLGTDSLGASGAEAWVDNHYAERFGGAIMLSFIDDLFATAANATSKNNSDVSIDNTTSNAESMASKALDNTINIPPTAYINQGEMMNILVPRNIDFSSVYINR